MTATLLALSLALPARAEFTRIGAAGAASGGVTAAAPGAAARGLRSGGEVFHNDDVLTDAKGRLQVLLLDQTVFTVGPKSDIVLDEFVYDPFTDAGRVSAQVKQGVFRFVTGKVARKDPAQMKVKVPAGTIGIRGTIAGGRVDPDGTSLVVLLGPGPANNADERVGGVTVDTPNGSVDLDRPGTATRLVPGAPPTPPFRLSPEDLRSLDLGKGKASASDAAGQTTAVGGAGALDALRVGGEQQSTSQASNTSAQDATQAILDGLATWDNVRTVQDAHAYYSGSAPFNLSRCNGGACASPSGNLNYTMNIDFAGRTVGGACASSSISGFASDPNTSTSINFSIPISQVSFAALTGNARLNLVSGSASATVDLVNQGGVAAARSAVSVRYDDGSSAGSGSLNVPRTPGNAPLF